MHTFLTSRFRPIKPDARPAPSPSSAVREEPQFDAESRHRLIGIASISRTPWITVRSHFLRVVSLIIAQLA
jgi:hypothetical protein